MARTKTEAIVNNVLAPHWLTEVLKIINDNNISFIGVRTDGSNHGAVKIFSTEKFKVVINIKFLNIPILY